MGITLDTIDGAIHSIQITDGTDTLAINADGSLNTSATYAYNEDSVHGSGDAGAFVLAVRADTKASTAGTDGDYAALIQDADGDLYVSDTVAQGSLSTLAGAIDGTEMQVDIVTMPGIYVEDAASSGGENLMLVGGYRQDADTSPVSADGDFHGFIFNNLGELKVSSKLDNTANSSVVVTYKQIDTTAGGQAILASQLTGRREITIQNHGSQSGYFKNGTGVTAGDTGNGFEVPAKSSASFTWGDQIDLYGITSTSTADLKIIEAA